MPDLPERSQPRRRWRGTDHIGPLLRDPALTINEIVMRRLGEQGFEGFTTAHGTIGMHIADEGSRVTELAELAQVSKPTVVYLVNEMERRGYVARRPDPLDGRAKLVCMTEKGVRAQRAGGRIVRDIEHDWSALMGERDFERLRELLTRLHDALWPPAE
jgi:DNA-binding MarR family transcriptional regulator